MKDKKSNDIWVFVEIKEDGSVQLIRRAEKPADYFATFDCFDFYDNLIGNQKK